MTTYTRTRAPTNSRMNMGVRLRVRERMTVGLRVRVCMRTRTSGEAASGTAPHFRSLRAQSIIRLDDLVYLEEIQHFCRFSFFIVPINLIPSSPSYSSSTVQTASSIYHGTTLVYLFHESVFALYTQVCLEQSNLPPTQGSVVDEKGGARQGALHSAIIESWWLLDRFDIGGFDG
jgi:hypothetical protein